MVAFAPGIGSIGRELECLPNAIFWRLLKKFGEALIIDIAVDLTKEIFFSPTHKNLHNKGYKRYQEVPVYYHPKSSMYSYTMVRKRNGDIIDSQTPFLKKSNLDSIDTAVIFREAELAALVQMTEFLKEREGIEIIKKIILPEKVASRDWYNTGDSSNGAVVFFTENGKVDIIYEKTKPTKINAKVNIFPNKEVKNSQSVLQRQLEERFEIHI